MMNEHMPSYEILQTCIYPANEDFGSAEKYLRTEGGVYFNDEVLCLQEYSRVQFDTYYNAFSIPLWKERVKLPHACLKISGRGKVIIELWEVSRECLGVGLYGFPRKQRARRIVELTEELTTVFELAIADNQELSGLLYPKIIAVENSEVSSLLWTTTCEKRRSVKLGISVTHFNRKHYVIPAIRRIKQDLLTAPEWSDKIDFVVVDNSRDLTPQESSDVRVIPNENTGGTGGFMRGLLHYKYATDATHVLFMDDDASLEIESIKRAYQILSYAVEDNTAVGAALFYEDNPNFLIERGACLSKSWVWVEFHNCEAVAAWDVLNTELAENRTTTYMGWWFAAFPLASTERLVPPFFVRGDDVSFAQLNDFNIIFGNGIACYAQSFYTKVSGATTYFDTINSFVVNALFNNRKSLIFAQYIRRYIEQLVSGRYGYVEVMRLALKQFGRLDAKRFVENSALDPMIPVFKELTSEYCLQELDTDAFTLADRMDRPEGKLRRFGRLLTFNKLFLPLNNKKVVKQDSVDRACFKEIAGYRRILYLDTKSSKGFMVKLSRPKTLKYLLLLLGDALVYLFAYPATRRRLLKHYDYLTSEQMWEEIFGRASE